MTAVFTQGANYRSVGTVLSDTNETTVYTVASTGLAAVATHIRVSDDAADARTITLRWTDNSASTTYTLYYQKAIAANTALVEDLFLAMDYGDTLKCTASAAGMHVVVTVNEIGGRQR